MANSNPRQPDVIESPDKDGRPSTGGPDLAVPPENREGHRPEHDQDKPDLNAMAEAYGLDDEPGDDRGSSRAKRAITVAAFAAGAVGAVVGGLVVWRMVQRRRRSRLAVILARLGAERLPSAGTIRDQLPNPAEWRAHLPSGSDLRDRVPSASEVRERVPSTSGWLDRLPDVSDLSGLTDRVAGRSRRRSLPFRR